MSFSDDVRSELALIAPERECDRLAELSALFHFAGRLHLLGRGDVSLHLDLASAAVARRAFALLRSFGVGSEIRTYRRRAFGQETRYQLHVETGRRSLDLLRECGVVDAQARAARATAEARARPGLLPGRVPARSAPGGRLGERAAVAASRGPKREPRGRGDGRRRRGRRGRRPTRLGPPRPLGRVREGNRPDRGRARSSGRERRGAGPAGARGRRLHASAGEPPRERRPREPGPHEPSRPRATRSGPPPPGSRAAWTSSPQTCARLPNFG